MYLWKYWQKKCRIVKATDVEKTEDLSYMSKNTNLYNEAIDMLRATSRTFFIPINGLTPNLKEAVASAYLCMRAIDEIEDHQQLPASTKISLLNKVGNLLESSFSERDFSALFSPYQSSLPDVTLRIHDWIQVAPKSIQEKIFYWTSVMSKGMAKWVGKDWDIQTQEDLNSYTYYVAGLVGLLLDDIWKWHDGTSTDRELAVAYGRGLQAVNIIRNRKEDLERGVDFFPDGWDFPEMFGYAKRNLSKADRYVEELEKGPILDFCKIPLALAHGTLKAIELGKTKLSRDSVLKIVQKVTKK